MNQSYRLPQELIEKYNVSGPRYTSYPTAPVWGPVDRGTQRDWYQELGQSSRPLSLYFHIPFCRERCSYCGCNTMITQNQGKATDYVTHLLKEIDTLASFGLGHKKIRQLHFGGGTPTFLLDQEFALILGKLREHFEFEESAELAIEVDPCSTHEGQLEMLAGLGFNRLSLGLQDFNPKVQAAVNRVQSYEITKEHIDKARQLGFTGVNLDLMYGLPHQTLASMRETLEQVISLAPDRLALYNFAYLPEQLPHQKLIHAEHLPDEETKLNILFEAISRFAAAGYEYIGMDHFAKSTDELAVAQRERRLYRNFMGYSPKSGVDLVGIGITSIGESERYFLQNEKKLPDYLSAIEQEGLAGARGIHLTDDDRIRKWTIIRLICHFYVNFDEFLEEFDLDFTEYFQKEMAGLEDMIDEGLVEVGEGHIRVLSWGKILVRNICMRFDAYLTGEKAPKVKFSKTI
ncbi:MAG: oxygen-independent coproporphyrinogen III oxidase [bacterium]|nr:oxygen-independent coproporphyrinogen III oxidase [bacterium]